MADSIIGDSEEEIEEEEQEEELKEIYFTDAFVDFLNTLPLKGTLQKEPSAFDPKGEFWSLKLPNEWQNLMDFFARTASNLYSDNERVHTAKNELFNALRSTNVVPPKASNQQDVLQFFPPTSPTGLHITIAQPDLGVSAEKEVIHFEIEKLHTYRCDDMQNPSHFNQNCYVAQYFSIKTKLTRWENEELADSPLPVPTRSLCHITYACAGYILPSRNSSPAPSKTNNKNNQNKNNNNNNTSTNRNNNNSNSRNNSNNGNAKNNTAQKKTNNNNNNSSNVKNNNSNAKQNKNDSKKKK